MCFCLDGKISNTTIALRRSTINHGGELLLPKYPFPAMNSESERMPSISHGGFCVFERWTCGSNGEGVRKTMNAKHGFSCGPKTYGFAVNGEDGITAIELS